MASRSPELFTYLDSIAHERGVSREELLLAMEEAVLNSAKRSLAQTRELEFSIDRKTGEFHCQAKLIVKKQVTNPADEISLREAQTRYPEAKEDDEVIWKKSPESFGRIVAQTARQIFSSRQRMIERRTVCEQFAGQEGQLINGEVIRRDREGILIRFSGAEGLLRKEDKIPGEMFDEGDLVTALLVEINLDKPGPSLIVSRATPDFVRRLFEREVTEISDGLVEIMGVAREAGYRSKIAVRSTESRVDPSGACIGQHGNRVRTIVRELSGEKVDVIEWNEDPKIYITNALKPARLLNVSIDEAKKVAQVTVQQDQLSLAIGKKGQNARLATRLTGWKIDISAQETTEQSQEEAFEQAKRRAIETLGAVDGIGVEAAEVLVSNGYVSLEGLAAPEVELEDIAGLPGFDEARAASVIAAAKAALGK